MSRQTQSIFRRLTHSRPLRILARAIGGVLIIVLCSIVIALLVLRTSWAEKRLTTAIPGILNPVLAEQGLSLELDSLQGPLPGRLFLSGLRLHDQHGLFMEVGEVEADLALSKLLGDSLTVNLARIGSPKIHRMPDLLPATEQDLPEQPSGGPGIAINLPIAVNIKQFQLEGAVVPWQMLGMTATEEPHIVASFPEAPATPPYANQQQTNDGEKKPQANQPSPPQAKTSNAVAALSAASPSTTGSPPQPETAQSPSQINLAWQASQQNPLLLDASATALLAGGHLSAAAQVRIRDGASLLSPSAEISPPPGSNLDMTLVISAIEADVAEPTANKLSMDGDLRLMLGDIQDSLAIQLAGKVDETNASLQTFLLEGLGLKLSSSATVALATGHPTATLSLASKEDAVWKNLVSGISGLDTAQLDALASPLALSMELDHENNDLTLALQELRAGIITGAGQARIDNLFASASLQKALGQSGTGIPVPPATLPAGGKNTPAHDGFPPEDNTGNAREKEMLPTEHATGNATGYATGSVTGNLPLMAEVAATPVRLTAQFAFQADDLAPLGADVSGPLTADIKLTGLLPDITGELSFSSAALHTPAGILSALEATLKASMDNQTDGGIKALGNIRVSAAPDAIGNTHVNADWNVDLPAQNPDGTYGKPVLASLKNLQLSIFGLSLDGNIQTSIGPALLSGQPLSVSTQPLLWPGDLKIDGSVRAAVADWEPLSALAQTTIQGNSMTASLNLDNTVAEQHLSLDINSGGLNLPQQDVVVDSLSLTMDTRLPTTTRTLPALSLDLQAGKGQAGEFFWEKITALVAGNDATGNFSAQLLYNPALFERQKKTAKANDNTVRSPSQTAASFKSALSKNEMLSLTGQYDLKDMHLTLASLAVKEPVSQTEVQLRAPATVNFAQGVSLEGLTLDFSAGGSITAQLAHNNAALQAQASIDTLPLGLINDLAGTTLPEGQLDINASIQTGSRQPQGNLLAELRLASPQALFSARDSRPGNMTSSPSGQTSNTGVNVTSGLAQRQADVMVQAAITQAEGRSYLTGGMDFSVLAHSLQAAADAGSPILSEGGVLPVSGTVATPHSLAVSPDGASSMPLTFRVPLSVQDGIPTPDMDGPFHAQLQWYGSVDGFWRLVPLPDTEFSALAAIDLGLSGSLRAPRTGGTAHIAKGRFYDKGAGLLLTDINLEAHASSNDEFRMVLAAGDGTQGTLGLEGKLQLQGSPSLNLRGQISHLSPLHRDDIDIVLSGIFSAAGPLNEPEVKASILVERGEITLLSTLGNGSVAVLPITDPREELSEASPMNGTLDVTVNIPRRFYIRGRGLDSEWQGNLRVTGALAEPELTGSLSPVRGYFELLSKPFAFSGGDIVFAGGSKINPGLNLELTYTTPELEAIIITGGNLEKPTLDLQSRPVLPSDEVLAHVLFGKRISELSRFEALQLANSMRELAGIGSGDLNPLTTMRKATGLDVLRFGSEKGQATRQDSGTSGASNLGDSSSSASSETSNPTLEAGKYINDSIYVGVEQGMTQESTGVRVEIELFPSVTVQGKTTSTSSSAGIGWKMDY